MDRGNPWVERSAQPFRHHLRKPIAVELNEAMSADDRFHKTQGCGNRGKTNCMFFHCFHSPYYWKSQKIDAEPETTLDHLHKMFGATDGVSTSTYHLDARSQIPSCFSRWSFNFNLTPGPLPDTIGFSRWSFNFNLSP